MNRLDERRELLGIFAQLREAALATYPPNLSKPEELHLDRSQWEEVQPTAEGLGFDVEILHDNGPARLTGRIAGTRVSMLVQTVGCFDALSTTVRESYSAPPQQATYDPQAPRRAIGNFETRAASDRTLDAARHNLAQAKASGNLALVNVMADALKQAEKLARWVRTEVLPSLTTSERVAMALCQAVREQLTADQLEKVILRNDQRRQAGRIGHRCASNAYLDIISLLDEMWTATMGQECELSDPEQAQYFDDAFTLAREADYDPAQVPQQAQAA